MFSISKQGTNHLKGFGIIIIVLHNYFHLLSPGFGENEFSFDSGRWSNFLLALTNTPVHFFDYTIAFFGHYGVSLFIFLSAYGIAKRYENIDIRYSDFILGRIKKLYPAFILAILLYIPYSHFIGTSINGYFFYQIALKLGAISNFVNGEYITVCGPWWFFVMIIQFYLVFPTLYKLTKKYSYYFLIPLNIVSLLLVYLYSGNDGFITKSTFIGFIPEISIAFLFIQNRAIKLIDYKLLPVWFILLIAGQQYKIFWLISSLSFTLIFISLYSTFNKIKLFDNWNYLEHIGSISFYIFLTNGFLRYPLILFSLNDSLGGRWYLMIVIICFIYCISILLLNTEQCLRNRIENIFKS